MKTTLGFCLVACLLVTGCGASSRLSRDAVQAKLERAGIQFEYLILDKDGSIYLDLYGHLIHDLAPLRELPIRTLGLAHTGVEDISQLGGMQIQFLFVDHTTISDLAVIRSLPLKNLSVSHCPRVTSIAELKGLEHLQTLNIAETSVSDLSPLDGMHLETLVFSPERITNGISVIRSMGTLKNIGVMEVDEKGKDLIRESSPETFWGMYKAGNIYGKRMNKPSEETRK